MNLEPWQWALAICGGLLVGISKTGIAGLGMLFVVIFAQILPAKQASGVVLPLLICGDVFAVTAYRRHANWSHMWRLFPWAGAGVLGGFFALGRNDDHQARVLVGGIVLALLVLHVVRRGRAKDDEPEHAAWCAPTIGVLAGFTTLVANAAGPLMAIYLLAMRLPKMEFVGTAAVFFLLLNLFKVPFMARLGLINVESLKLNAVLVPAVIAGAAVGRMILTRINQKLFELLALVLSAAAGVRLLF